MRKKQEKPKATIYPKKLTITNEKKEKKGSNKDNKISEIMKLLNLETSEKVNDSKKGKNTNFDKIDNNQKGDNFIKKQNIENSYYFLCSLIFLEDALLNCLGLFPLFFFHYCLIPFQKKDFQNLL